MRGDRKQGLALAHEQVKGGSLLEAGRVDPRNRGLRALQFARPHEIQRGPRDHPGFLRQLRDLARKRGYMIRKPELLVIPSSDCTVRQVVLVRGRRLQRFQVRDGPFHAPRRNAIQSLRSA